MSDPIPVAVIGAGHLGSIHARVLAELPVADLRAVVDVDEARAAEVANAHGARPLTSPDQLGGDIRAVVVATPTVAHRDVSVPLLGKGVSCLVEKPIATSPEEGRAMIDAARVGGATLMVGHSERFNPVVVALDAYDIRPRFIDSQRVSPFTFRSADIGVVLDLMIHDIDIMLHLIDSEVTGIHAVGVPVIGDTEDLANARIAFKNGAVANATASRVALKTERVIRIFSPDCYCTLNLHEKTGRVIRPGPALASGEIDFAAAMEKGMQNPLAFMQSDIVRFETLEIGDTEPLAAEDTAFLHAVRTGEPPPVTGEHGLLALETAQRIVKSLEESLAKAREADA